MGVEFVRRFEPSPDVIICKRGGDEQVIGAGGGGGGSRQIHGNWDWSLGLAQRQPSGIVAGRRNRRMPWNRTRRRHRRSHRPHRRILASSTATHPHLDVSRNPDPSGLQEIDIERTWAWSLAWPLAWAWSWSRSWPRSRHSLRILNKMSSSLLII